LLVSAKIPLLSRFPDGDFVFGKVLFCFQRRHAAGSGRGDRLAEDLVLHIAGRKHASNRRARGARRSTDVALMIHVDVTREHAGGRQRRVVVRGLALRRMEERTGDGYVFRTDLRLRPDPASTPPAISVAAASPRQKSRAVSRNLSFHSDQPGGKRPTW